MPPSANRQLMWSNQRRFMKSKEARVFDNQVRLFGIVNRVRLDQFTTALHIWIEGGWLLQVDCFFIFDKQKLLTKKGEVKQRDSNNYLKATLDGLVKCIAIDDKYFVSGFYEKLWKCSEKDDNVILKISPTMMRPETKLIESIL